MLQLLTIKGKDFVFKNIILKSVLDGFGSGTGINCFGFTEESIDHKGQTDTQFPKKQHFKRTLSPC
jgi:hypothetical protein